MGGNLSQQVDVLEVRLRDVRDTYPLHGTVEADVEVPLHFETEGVIASFEYGNGDRVGKGELIAKLDGTEAEADLEEAEIELRQSEELFARGGETLDELRRRRIKVKKAAIQLKKTLLIAPTGGVLSSKEVVTGQFVTPVKVVARLLNLESVRVLADVVEKAVDRVAQGQKVRFTVATYPEVEFWGRVGRMDIKADRHTYQIEVPLKNEGNLLLPGMMAKLEIVLFEASNVVSVPPEALAGGGEAADRIFVVEKGKARSRSVGVSYRASGFVVIDSGLSPGDEVIVRRSSGLREGDSVKVGARE